MYAPVEKKKVSLDNLFFFLRKMLNLIKIKGQKKEDAANANGKPPAKKQSPGELRLHKGLPFHK